MSDTSSVEEYNSAEMKLMQEFLELNVITDEILSRLLELKKLTAPDGTLCIAMKKARALFESHLLELGIVPEDLKRMASLEEEMDLTQGTDTSSIQL